MMYRFSKLYLDTVTHDNTVAIVYLTKTEVLGLPSWQCMIEIYYPDGRFESLRGRAVNRYADVSQVIKDGSFRFELPDGVVHVRLKPIDDHWYPSGEALADHLNWSVCAAKMEVSIDIIRKQGELFMHGAGYADLAALTRLPRSYGIQQLDWGRIHWPHASLVFNAVQFSDGRRWCRMGSWSEGQFTESQQSFNLTIESDGIRMLLPGKNYLLEPIRILHHGPAVDKDRFPDLIERTFFRLVSGQVSETRWLSCVHDLLSNTPGIAIHEQVCFGDSVRKVKPVAVKSLLLPPWPLRRQLP